MADEIEIAKNSLDVISGVFQLGSTFSDVSNIITVSASAFPLVGAILTLVKGFLPGEHAEILSLFHELNNQFHVMRNDINNLKHEIKWEIEVAKDSGALNCLELGIEYCLEIGKRSKEDEKRTYQERLKRTCANEKCTEALRSLLNRMSGTGILPSSSILDKYYDRVKGNRSKISDLAARLLQVASGGLLVISTYDTMVYGKKYADNATRDFYGQVVTARDVAQRVRKRCENNFKGFMLDELNTFLDKGGSNQDLVNQISYFMRYKYDFLENFVVVYNDMWGFNNHCFNGFRVDSLHRNGKCGIVFYRTKGEDPRFSHRSSEAYKILDDVHSDGALDAYRTIESKLNDKGIGWTGCLVISRNIYSAYPDICYKGTFSTTTVNVNKYKTQALGWYFSHSYHQVLTGKAILLLE